MKNTGAPIRDFDGRICPLAKFSLRNVSSSFCSVGERGNVVGGIIIHCKWANWKLGLRNALHFSVSRGVIQRKEEAWCRWDNCPLYEPPTESSLGVQSVLKSLTLIQHSLDIQNLMWKLVGLKLRISEVLQTLSYLSQKIHLILAVTTVVLPSLYMLWGTRSGTCRVFVYILLREIPWEYWAVLYIVEKVFSKGSQRRWNREKRFSIHGEIKGTR